MTKTQNAPAATTAQCPRCLARGCDQIIGSGCPECLECDDTGMATCTTCDGDCFIDENETPCPTCRTRGVAKCGCRRRRR